MRPMSAAGELKNHPLPLGDERVTFPKYVSDKLDGIRCILYPDGQLISKAGKHLPNRELLHYFQDTLKYASSLQLVLDGELLYTEPEYTFQDVVTAVMSHSFIPLQSFGYKLFDAIPINDWYNESEKPYVTRQAEQLRPLVQKGVEYTSVIHQTMCHNWQEALAYYENFVQKGGEGIIVRDPCGSYKHGKCTIRENNVFKFKHTTTEDAVVVDYYQRTENTAERIEDAFGKSKTTCSKADDVYIEELGGIVVKNEQGETFNIGSGFSQAERVRYWKDPQQLIGRWCEFKYLKVGIKNKPRQPTFVRWRDPK